MVTKNLLRTECVFECYRIASLQRDYLYYYYYYYHLLLYNFHRLYEASAENRRFQSLSRECMIDKKLNDVNMNVRYILFLPYENHCSTLLLFLLLLLLLLLLLYCIISLF